MDLRTALVQTIDAERGVRRWSVPELARRSGIPYGTLRNYLEHGRDFPLMTLFAVAAALGWRTSELMIEAERRIDADEAQQAAAGS